MNTRDNNRTQQPQQQGSGSSAQQGGTSTSGTSASSTQQDQYAPARQRQQGDNSVAPRTTRSSLPSLWERARSPLELIRQLDEDMDRMYRQFWGGDRGLARGRGGAELPTMWMPQVEVYERDGKLHVHADLPGLKKEEISIHIDNEQLVIQGERRSAHDDDKQQSGGYFHSERSYGSFCRTIPLPEGVNVDTADASFKDGVLKVHFDAPKQPQAQKRQLNIRDEK